MLRGRWRDLFATLVTKGKGVGLVDVGWVVEVGMVVGTWVGKPACSRAKNDVFTEY